MTGKRRNLYLYLALACFLGILLIFVLDGYIGVYDKLTVDNRQFVRTFDTRQWDEPDERSYLATVNVDQGGSIDFTYGINNNRFSRYYQPIRVYLETSPALTTELLNADISARAFGSDEITWSLDTAGLVPANTETEAIYSVDMVIEHGGTQRVVHVYIDTSTRGIKSIPAPQ